MEKTNEETRIEETKKALTEIAQRQIRESFLPEYREAATEEEGLGIAIAHHFRWDGISIMKTFAEALEDANFHTHCATVRRWIEQDAKPDQTPGDTEKKCGVDSL